MVIKFVNLFLVFFFLLKAKRKKKVSEHRVGALQEVRDLRKDMDVGEAYRLLIKQEDLKSLEKTSKSKSHKNEATKEKKNENTSFIPKESFV